MGQLRTVNALELAIDTRFELPPLCGLLPNQLKRQVLVGERLAANLKATLGPHVNV